MNEEQKVEVIIPEAVVELKISTGFYQKMQILLQSIIKEKESKIEDAYEQIKNNDIKESWVSNLETVLIFVTDFQRQAKENGFVKSMTKSELEAHLEEFNNKSKS